MYKRVAKYNLCNNLDQICTRQSRLTWSRSVISIVNPVQSSPVQQCIMRCPILYRAQEQVLTSGKASGAQLQPRCINGVGLAPIHQLSGNLGIKTDNPDYTADYTCLE